MIARRTIGGLVTAVAVLALLAGCSGDALTADLQAFVEEVEARPSGAIEPLPEFLAYQPFVYSAAGMRSPFEPPVPVTPKGPGGPRSDVKPDTNRVKQYLEQFNITELRMVGTLQNDSVLYALIQDADGGVHRVTQGDYMGTNHGRIVGITEGEIQLQEIVSDGAGGWLDRARTVNLAEAAGA